MFDRVTNIATLLGPEVPGLVVQILIGTGLEACRR